MSYPLHTRAIIGYIESHVKKSAVGNINDLNLEKHFCYSYAHIRDFFKKNTGISLGEYIRNRKICASAFDLLYSKKTIMEIALDYGFSNHESFTRAFSKYMKKTPSNFRKERPLMGKSELTNGIYGIGLLRQKETRSKSNMKKENYQNDGSTILYGVPKIEWGTYGGCTPFPICLTACAEYLGDDLDYSEVFVASGGAFRFTWNQTFWDMSNVDIYHTFTEFAEETVYSYAPKALGREFDMLGRTESTTKQEFIDFIKNHIDKGHPCIAQGIIGPPEVCIITGYKNNGNTLLGWNFFQNDPAFGGNLQFDDCGYFVCDNWWENTDTQSVMCLGAVSNKPYTTKQIIQTAIKVMTGRQDKDYFKGVSGFDYWAKSLSNDSDFDIQNEATLFEKLACQDDATVCIKDGRGAAANYFKKLAEKETNNSELSQKYKLISDIFNKEKTIAEKMWNLLSTNENMEDRPKNFVKKETRSIICKNIKELEILENKVLKSLEEINSVL